LGIGLGFALGTVLAVMRLSANRLLSSVAWAYVWLFRSVPLILQLLFWYNLALLYPRLSVGIPFGPEFFDFGTMDLIGPVTAAAPDPPAAVLVQPGAALSPAVGRDPVRAGVLRLRHHGPDRPGHRRGARARPAPGRLRGRDRARRAAVGGPRAAGGRRGARPAA